MRKVKPLPSVERLRELLNYDPETGVFSWKTTAPVGRWKGCEAGRLMTSNRIIILVDKTLFYAHRLAWKYVYGVDPAHEIDHIDGNGTNNRIANLRDVSHRMNIQNFTRPNRNNKLGVLGVNAAQGKFVARINVMGRIKTLGYFDTTEEAHQVYLNAKRKYHEGCTI